MNNNAGFMNGFNTMCEWIVKFAYLNVLWFLFMVLGLGIFGIFPATIAMFTIIRKWIMGDTNRRMFPLFWETYKTEFIKSNKLGVIFAVIGFILYIDLLFVFTVENTYAGYLFFPLIMMALVYVLTLLYVFPVYVHYDITIRQTIKNAFFIMVFSPISSALLVLSIFTLWFLAISFPAVIPFFSVNVLSWLVMYFANHSFLKIQRKQVNLANKS
ncbi:putative membrane protein YesL [Virgibacillus natechei]|uniref:Membrane protein YesL n=1 Tax=Virgibacillus natechei TaxID=1216297 RepID=A0ABS4IE98_9BACI|nr:YesL family protein [Virgibacillus natechei]MBP1969258.1 putative membrane protein YesL [Virgibacillus natechei]UZD12416.1 YesL family protein [Virgibacillus natechei]